MDTDALIVALVSLAGVTFGLWRVAAWWRARRAEREALRPPSLPSSIVSLMRALPGMTIVIDRDDRVVWADVGALAVKLVRDGALTSTALTEALATFREWGSVDDLEIPIPGYAASARPGLLTVTLAPLGDEKVVIIARDAAPTRDAEEMRRQFVADVSHELKTPVGAISLLAETIEDAADDPTAVRAFAARLHHESARLSRLVGDIIELSRVQGPVSMTLSPQPLGPIIEAALAREALTAEEAGIEIVTPDAFPLAIVRADARGLEGAFANLVNNAVRYSPAGSTIRLSVTVGDTSVAVSVADDGIGIDPADHERIFTRFYRVDLARLRSSGGTGLGLSIVKHTVAHHRGTVRVRSALGEGATFTVTLPLAAPADHYLDHAER